MGVGGVIHLVEVSLFPYFTSMFRHIYTTAHVHACECMRVLVYVGVYVYVRALV